MCFEHTLNDFECDEMRSLCICFCVLVISSEKTLLFPSGKHIYIRTECLCVFIYV